MYIIAAFAKNRAENKTRPNSRRNSSGLCGRWEAKPKAYTCTPDAVRLFLLASYCERCLGRTHSARGVRLGISAGVYHGKEGAADRQSPLHYR